MSLFPKTFVFFKDDRFFAKTTVFEENGKKRQNHTSFFKGDRVWKKRFRNDKTLNLFPRRSSFEKTIKSDKTLSFFERRSSLQKTVQNDKSLNCFFQRQLVFFKDVCFFQRRSFFSKTTVFEENGKKRQNHTFFFKGDRV